jgi:hypothetical protein
MGKNVLVDGSLRDADWYSKYVHGLKARFPKIKIGIINVTADMDVILARSKARSKVTGRVVPEVEIYDAVSSIDETIYVLTPYLDVLATFENNKNHEQPHLTKFWKRTYVVHQNSPNCKCRACVKSKNDASCLVSLYNRRRFSRRSLSGSFSASGLRRYSVAGSSLSSEVTPQDRARLLSSLNENGEGPSRYNTVTDDEFMSQQLERKHSRSNASLPDDNPETDTNPRRPLSQRRIPSLNKLEESLMPKGGNVSDQSSLVGSSIRSDSRDSKFGPTESSLQNLSTKGSGSSYPMPVTDFTSQKDMETSGKRTLSRKSVSDCEGRMLKESLKLNNANFNDGDGSDDDDDDDEDLKPSLPCKPSRVLSLSALKTKTISFGGLENSQPYETIEDVYESWKKGEISWEEEFKNIFRMSCQKIGL